MAESSKPGAGVLIVFEGPEGCGKSTQARLLAAALGEAGRDVVLTREPGGTEIGEAIRAILFRDWPYAMLPATEALLHAAARAQHVGERIRPALIRGAVVICDRFADSSLAYQAGGQGLSMTAVRELQAFALDGLQPDLRILLDLPIKVGLGRRFSEPDAVNRLDLAGVAFHERVRATYHDLVRGDPANWVVIDAEASVERVFAEVLGAVTSAELFPPATVAVPAGSTPR